MAITRVRIWSLKVLLVLILFVSEKLRGFSVLSASFKILCTDAATVSSATAPSGSHPVEGSAEDLIAGGASAVMSTRGLSPEEIPLFEESLQVSPPTVEEERERQWFRCLVDAEVVIPADAVNDDYCDCPDGSDEPGTVACSGIGQLFRPSGVPVELRQRFVVNGKAEENMTVLLSQHADHRMEGGRRTDQFFCANVGYVAKHIHQSFVNDGICDCCDGTDEWQQGERVCQDVCYEEARDMREARARATQELEAGIAARDAGKKAGKMWQKKSQQILEKLKTKLRAVERRVRHAEGRLKWLKQEPTRTTEAPEPSTGVQKKPPATASSKAADGTVSEFAKWALHDGIDDATEEKFHQSVVDEEEELSASAMEEEQRQPKVEQKPEDESLSEEGAADETSSLLDKIAWHARATTLAVMQYSRSMSRLLPRIDRFPPNDTARDYAKAIGAESVAEDVEQDVQNLDIVRYAQRWLVRVWHALLYLGKQTFNGGVDLYELLVPPDSTVLQQELSHLKSQAHKIKTRIDELEKQTSFSFGEDMEFFSLLHKCTETNFDGYNYDICFYGEAKQSEGAHVHSLGHSTSVVLEPLTTELLVNFPEESGDSVSASGGLHDDHGAGPPEAYIMRFVNGNKCHDGTHRELTVRFACGRSIEILQVHEPSRCRYFSRVKCPSACRPLPTDRVQASVNDKIVGGDSHNVPKEEL